MLGTAGQDPCRVIRNISDKTLKGELKKEFRTGENILRYEYNFVSNIKIIYFFEGGISIV